MGQSHREKCKVLKSHDSWDAIYPCPKIIVQVTTFSSRPRSGKAQFVFPPSTTEDERGKFGLNNAGDAGTRL